jgi:hypothetical protein
MIDTYAAWLLGFSAIYVTFSSDKTTMRSSPIPLIAALCLLPFFSMGQAGNYSLQLRSRTFIPPANISEETVKSLENKASAYLGRQLIILQFFSLPSEKEKIELKGFGIELLDYVPHNAYTATITTKIDAPTLSRFHIRSWVDLEPKDKIQPLLLSDPAVALNVRISFPRNFNYDEVLKGLLERNFTVVSSDLKDYRIISLITSGNRLEELASLPFVEYVERAPSAPRPLAAGWTQFGRDGIRTSYLIAPLSAGGKNLQGQGVVIGIGDDSDPQPHPDFSNRLISRSWQAWNFHGTHVAGIAGGAGIINELRKGSAPKSTILTQTFSDIITYAPAYVQDYGMVISNNSYGIVENDCNTFGVYTLNSRILDQQAFQLPSLQTVFAAGNSGKFICAPFDSSWHTVLGDYQAAKNVITVGNATGIGVVLAASSRGPVRDGRIKPEILAIGTAITSTVFQFLWNYYADNTGTSMSAPAISGGLALLYEKYRLMNAGANPPNGLMKALVCNSGDDWGNPGPDYIHGFGVANFWRAEQMLENNHFKIDSIPSGPDKTFTVNVPPGLADLKVMLYWNDPAASPVVTQSLVNDLDLVVEDPNALQVLPLVLDTASSQLNNPAHNGADHINNIEQVVIHNPVAGDYTFRVKATTIAVQSPQVYYLAYDFVPVETKLITPAGNEAYVHGDTVIVQWDSYGDPQENFDLDLSVDDGATWSPVRENIPANKRIYYFNNPNEWWVVPPVTTDQARMRIRRNGGSGIGSISEKFVIHDSILVNLSPVQCEGYISIDWNAVSNAVGYEVMMLRGTEMTSVAIVSSTTYNYTFSGLSKDSVYWVTVRPLIGSNTPGRRAFAVSRKPDTGTCAGTISDNDMKLDSLVSPAYSGRLFTSTSLSSSQVITIRIKNLDDAATTGSMTVGYKVDNNSAVTETITPNIIAGGTFVHSFAVPIDLSAPGTYTIKTFVTRGGDPVPANDTITKTIRQLQNAQLTGITYPSFYIDNFDATPDEYLNYKEVGITGMDRYDFINGDSLGRFRTFINSGISYSGNRAITLDRSRWTGAVSTDSLTATFNLSAYDTTSDDIRLDFRYLNHFELNYAANRVWVRGDDTKPWVLVYDLYANQNAANGTYKYSAGIEITDSLAAHLQNFSSSFQVRWGETGGYQATTNYSGGGYTFDDIRLYKVIDDIKMVSIDTPIVNSCGLSLNTPVAITLRNTANVVTAGIPVSYSLDGVNWINETAPALNANSTAQYIFSTPADMSVPGNYTIHVRVQYPTDNFNENDTLSLQLINNPVNVVTNSSPYFQDFENSNGDWYTIGAGSSWQYGTPASYRINRAASGIKAWKTRLAGTYNDAELSYLYSPCFDISTVSNPTLSFSLALDLEDCGGGLCDGAYMEYSTDGRNWARLGASGQGTNWYNKAYSNNNLWSKANYQRWHVATIPLSVIPIPVGQLTKLRFRFVLTSDASLNRDGIAFDDFYIYDNPFGIYTGVSPSPVVNQPAVNGTNWVDFVSGGKLLASIKPNGVDIGATDVQAFIYAGPVRISSAQFYHNRNITIKPATVNAADSVTVRFYFTDAETEILLNASGCNSCSKPTMAYELGVTKYSDNDDSRENGTLADNQGGIYSYLNNSKVKIIPFDIGYYAEFKVKDFSEFWLNNGGINNNTPLPVKLLSFTARKENEKDVLLTWRTAEETNLSHYEVEVARGNEEYQLNRFSTFATLNGRGTVGSIQEYTFLDQELNKRGTRYYRLKIVDLDGQVKYSPVRPVVFTNDTGYQLYPNPSAGIFYLVFQLPVGNAAELKLYDANGRIVKRLTVTGNGFLQKQAIDCTAKSYASGLYMLEVSASDKRQFFQLLKQ